MPRSISFNPSLLLLGKLFSLLLKVAVVVNHNFLFPHLGWFFFPGPIIPQVKLTLSWPGEWSVK